MKLIVGLGNPEDKYKTTRHNIGFVIIDHYAETYSVNFISKTKFKASIAKLEIKGEIVLLIKPTTYYNLSGEAVRSLTDYYSVESQDVLIIQDELALPFGTIRTRVGGSHAGNNGIKSVSQHIGDVSARLRIGIANPLLEHQDTADFVLGHFTKEESDKLDVIKKQAQNSIDSFIDNTFVPNTYLL
jgi:PTH1 family peptidyl-tRNA hydrolase